MTLCYDIMGHPYVKKSNQQVVYNAALRRRIKIDTPSYRAWHDSAVLQVATKRMPIPTVPIDYPINLQCRFFMKSNARTDLSALYEGIQDVLVELGVLKDDNWHIVASHDGSGVEKDAENPRMEITITKKETRR